MRRIAVAGLSTALAAGLLTWSAPVALACSVAVDPGLTAAQLDQKQLEAADLVFEGTAVRSEPDAGGQAVKWTFAVDRTLKGSSSGMQQVGTPASGATCGIDFEAGHRYRVYAGIENGTASAFLGNGTRELTDAGPTAAPLPTPQPRRPTFTG